MTANFSAVLDVGGTLIPNAQATISKASALPWSFFRLHQQTSTVLFVGATIGEDAEVLIFAYSSHS